MIQPTQHLARQQRRLGPQPAAANKYGLASCSLFFFFWFVFLPFLPLRYYGSRAPPKVRVGVASIGGREQPVTEQVGISASSSASVFVLFCFDRTNVIFFLSPFFFFYSPPPPPPPPPPLLVRPVPCDLFMGRV